MFPDVLRWYDFYINLNEMFKCDIEGTLKSRTGKAKQGDNLGF